MVFVRYFWLVLSLLIGCVPPRSHQATPDDSSVERTYADYLAATKTSLTTDCRYRATLSDGVGLSGQLARSAQELLAAWSKYEMTEAVRAVPAGFMASADARTFMEERECRDGVECSVAVYRVVLRDRIDALSEAREALRGSSDALSTALETGTPTEVLLERHDSDRTRIVTARKAVLETTEGAIFTKSALDAFNAAIALSDERFATWTRTKVDAVDAINCSAAVEAEFRARGL